MIFLKVDHDFFVTRPCLASDLLSTFALTTAIRKPRCSLLFVLPIHQAQSIRSDTSRGQEALPEPQDPSAAMEQP